MDPHEYLTTQQVGEMLQIPPATLHRWRYLGHGPPAYKIGRHLRYRRDEVERWVTAQGRAGEHR